MALTALGLGSIAAFGYSVWRWFFPTPQDPRSIRPESEWTVNDHSGDKVNPYEILDDMKVTFVTLGNKELHLVIQKGFRCDGASGPGVDVIDKWGWLGIVNIF